MTIEELKKYCLTKPGSTIDFPFDDKTLVFKVGIKMFALININKEPLQVNLKCDPSLAKDLRNTYSSIIPGYHMNKEHWNTVIDRGELEESKLTWLIDHSYGLVFSSLPKEEKRSIQGKFGIDNS